MSEGLTSNKYLSTSNYCISDHLVKTIKCLEYCLHVTSKLFTGKPQLIVKRLSRH